MQHKKIKASMTELNNSIQQLILLVKYTAKHPHLIKKFFIEAMNHGLKRSIIKLKIKYRIIERSYSIEKEYASLDKAINLFIKNPTQYSVKTDKPIDILIPIYNGIDYLDPLFKSIIKNTSSPYRLLICNDKSSDPGISNYLQSLKDNEPSISITIIENHENLGFIQSVNKLACMTQNHFVILNTDTELPPLWIERLMQPIFEMKNIASTTPFTNAGTICSFPNFLEDNPIFDGLTVDEIDREFQYVNFKSTQIEIPSGVGFCMGINKNAADKIGMFNPVFGKGYGEENDWCQRAIKNGYKNLQVTNLYVYHKHGGSFESEEKKLLIKNNLSILNKLHPTYSDQVDEFILKDELYTLRSLLTHRIKSSHSHSCLIFDHNLGGGAHEYIKNEIEKKINNGESICYIRYDYNLTNQYYIDLISPPGTYKLNTKNFNELYQFISLLNFNEIFVNSLATYPRIQEVINLITDTKSTSNSEIIIPIHDYLPICPNYNLLNELSNYCGVPQDLNRCHTCLSNSKRMFNIFEGETDVSKWRSDWEIILNSATRIICFSKSSNDILLKAYPNISEKIKIIPHTLPVIFPKIYDQKTSQQMRIGVLGAINEAKGAHIIIDLVKYIETHEINAKVILFGHLSIPFKSVHFETSGPYEKNKLPQMIRNKNITQFIVPSICPETFSYTTEEIMQMGYPVIVFNIGAPPERVKNYELGKVIEISELYKTIFNKTCDNNPEIS